MCYMLTCTTILYLKKIKYNIQIQKLVEKEKNVFYFIFHRFTSFSLCCFLKSCDLFRVKLDRCEFWKAVILTNEN